MKLPIADCRLPIKKLFAGRGFAGGCHDGRQGVSFIKQGGQFARGHDAGFDQEFEPQCGFIGFFFNDPNFSDELCLTARTATRAVICSHRSAAADNLFGDDAGGIVIFWNRFCQLDDSQSKSFRARLKFNRSHGMKLQIKSAIGNRQSAIQKNAL